MFDAYIAERLAKLRMEKGVSARDMSLSIGQSANYINKIENKKAYPSMKVFYLICEYFNITPKDFFDSDKAYPGQLNELVEDLNRLDKESLTHISGIVKGLIGNTCE